LLRFLCYEKSLINVLPNDETFILLSKLFTQEMYWQGANKLVRAFDRHLTSKKASKESIVGVIKYLSRIGSFECTKKAAVYLKTLLLDFSFSKSDINIGNIVLKAMISSGAALEANRLLRYDLDPHGIRPNTDLIWSLISAISQNTDKDAFGELEMLADSLIRYNVTVDDRVVQAFFMCISRSTSGDVIARAERVFKEYVIDRNLTVSTKLLNCLLDVYAKSNQVNAAESCEKILMHRFDAYNAEPDTVSYNTVISAWSRSKKLIAFQKALNVFKSGVLRGVVMTVISYTALLTALSRSKNPDAPDVASKLFSSMRESGISPDLQTWTIYLGIWSKRSCEKAQEIFDNMLAEGVQPNNVTYTTLLSMWGKSSQREASLKIRDIFKQLKQTGRKLDAVGYSSLLSAMSSNAANDPSISARALDVFDTMKLHGFIPDLQAYTILIGCLGKSPIDCSDTIFSLYAELIRDGLVPSSVTFSTILGLLRYSKHANAKYWLDTVYSDMLSSEKFIDGQTVKSLVGALSSHYSKLDVASKVDKLVTKFIKREIPVDQSACNTIFRAWENVEPFDVYYVQQAGSFLDLMISNGMKPSAIAYSSLMSLLSQTSNSTESIQQLFEIYRMRREESSDPTVYNAMLSHGIDQAAKFPGKINDIIAKTDSILETMVNDSVVPNNSTLTTILQIYAIACECNRELVPTATKIVQNITTLGQIKHNTLSLNTFLSVLSLGRNLDSIYIAEKLLNDTNVANGATYFHLFRCYASAPFDPSASTIFRSLYSHFQSCINSKFMNPKLFTVFLKSFAKWLPAIDRKYHEQIVSNLLQTVKSVGIDIDEKFHMPLLSKVLDK